MFLFFYPFNNALINCLSSFLQIGVTLVSFHLFGYVEVAKIFWKITLSGKTTELSHKSSIWPDIPTDPVGLLGFKCRINEIIPSLCMDIWSIHLSVRKFSGGNH